MRLLILSMRGLLPFDGCARLSKITNCAWFDTPACEPIPFRSLRTGRSRRRIAQVRRPAPFARAAAPDSAAIARTPPRSRIAAGDPGKAMAERNRRRVRPWHQCRYKEAAQRLGGV